MVHELADVTVTATATALTSTPTKCNWVLFTGVGSNPVARVGDKDVTTTKGGVVAATGGSLLLPAIADTDSYDLSLIFIVGTSGTVAVVYGVH